MIFSLEGLGKVVEDLRKKGKKIVSTNGCFDLIHIGHVRYLKQAKELGDVLIVALNSDSSVRKLKGENRPVVKEDERAEILDSLVAVDYVVIFGQDNPLDVLKVIKPDVHVKGGTFIEERVKEEKELVESFGGRMEILEEVRGKSSTKIMEKIRD